MPRATRILPRKKPSPKRTCDQCLRAYDQPVWHAVRFCSGACALAYAEAHHPPPTLASWSPQPPLTPGKYLRRANGDPPRVVLVSGATWLDAENGVHLFGAVAEPALWAPASESIAPPIGTPIRVTTPWVRP